ncbi:MAG: oligosaccharide flippase family protein [Christensenellales bacterium]
MKISFLKNTIILTLTSQLLRLIGVFFIAYLSDKIGTEGVGLYQLIVSIYFLASTLATSGIGVTIARLVAESLGKSKQKSTSDVLRKSVMISVVLGILVGIAVYYLADFIGESLLGDQRAILSIRMLAPGLPFMALTSCLHGYFYGVRKVLKPASQMIFEQIIRVLIIMCIINMFVPKGLEYACFAVIMASMISEALSCGYGFIQYRLEKRKSKFSVAKEAGIAKKIIAITIPIALSSYLRSGLKTAESILIPAGLKRYGASRKDALSQFGMIGMVMPVLFFPSGILTAIATLLLPEVSEAHAVGNTRKVKDIFARVFQFALLLSLLFCGIFVAFANDFGMLIYKNRQISALLTLIAPLLPLIYLDFIVDSMMTGLDQQLKTLKINIFDYTVRIGLILLLIPKFGVLAYILILYFSTFLNATLSTRRLMYVSGTTVDYKNWILKPFFSAATAGALVRIIFKTLPGITISGLVLLVKVILFMVLYISILFLVGCVSGKDIDWLKKMAGRTKQAALPD